jgi:hypothetical protein
MSTNSIQDYQESLRKLEAARNKVERFVVEIKNGANSLLAWDQVVISNVQVGFPPEAQVHSINADNWPTAQQLAEALSEWHKANHAVQNAWQAIPKADRTGLQPPPVR